MPTVSASGKVSVQGVDEVVGVDGIAEVYELTVKFGYLFTPGSITIKIGDMIIAEVIVTNSTANIVAKNIADALKDKVEGYSVTIAKDSNVVKFTANEAGIKSPSLNIVVSEKDESNKTGVAAITSGEVITKGINAVEGVLGVAEEYILTVKVEGETPEGNIHLKVGDNEKISIQITKGMTESQVANAIKDALSIEGYTISTEENNVIFKATSIGSKEDLNIVLKKK